MKTGINIRTQEIGTSLLSIIRKYHLFIDTDCGGKGLCGKCRIKVGPNANLSSPSLAEKTFFSEKDHASGLRLACQCIVNGPIEIELPGCNNLKNTAKTSLGKTGIKGNFSTNTNVRRLSLKKNQHPSA